MTSLVPCIRQRLAGLHRALLRAAEIDGPDAGWVLLHIECADNEPFLIVADLARVWLFTKRCERGNSYERSTQGTQRTHRRDLLFAELLLPHERLPWMNEQVCA